jgi:hypothetical protein
LFHDAGRVLFPLSGVSQQQPKRLLQAIIIIINTVVSSSSMKLLLLLLPWAASPLVVHGGFLLLPPSSSLHQQRSTSSYDFARGNINKNRLMVVRVVGDRGDRGRTTTRTALRSSRTRGRDDYMDSNRVDFYDHRRGRHHDDHHRNDDDETDEQLHEPEVFFRNELDSMQQMLNDQLLRSASPYSFDDHQTASTTVPPPEPFFLTHTALRRRQVEIRLLERLEQSDAAVDELMNVWIYEKPSAGQKAIDTILSLETHCESLEYTISTLRRLCGGNDDHQDWAELHNRLALVLALAGRTMEAAACVQKVLQLKPWHFEAQHLQVLLALQQHSQQQQQQRQWSPNHHGHHPTISIPAIRAARVSLPPLSQPQRRRRWVQTAVQQAEIRLAQDMARSQQQAAAVSSSLFTMSPAMGSGTTTTLTMTKENNDDGSSMLLSSWQ